MKLEKVTIGLFAFLTLSVTAGPVWAQDGVSPDTFYVATSGDDGVAYKSGPVYPPAGGGGVSTSSITANPYRGKISSTYYIYSLLVRWNTSSLPDNAVVTSATMRAYVTSISNTDSRNVTADYFAFGTIDSTDYSETSQTGALTGVALSSFTASAYNNVPLENLTNISLTGYTSLRFHISGDLPTEGNAMTVASWDNTSYTEPSLIIAWTVPASGPTSFTFGSLGNPAASNGIPIANIKAKNGRY